MAEAQSLEAPSLRAVRAVLADGPFGVASALGKWGVIGDAGDHWPHALFWIAARAREGAPERFALRLNLESYPQRGPTGAFWDVNANAWLEPARWPKGTGRVQEVFRSNWQGGRMLYHPLDSGSAAASSHPNSWPQNYRACTWSLQKTLVDYLEMVYELLNSEGYKGV